MEKLIMPYKVDNQGIWLIGTHVEPILLISTISCSTKSTLEGVVSYLNEQEKMFDNWRNKTEELLHASLTYKNLNKIQDEIAKMLSYPDATGFAKERIYSQPYEQGVKLPTNPTIWTCPNCSYETDKLDYIPLDKDNPSKGCICPGCTMKFPEVICSVQL